MTHGHALHRVLAGRVGLRARIARWRRRRGRERHRRAPPGCATWCVFSLACEAVTAVVLTARSS
ncbi:hypothetical protein [Nonomuraea dietziae]|uniref:hypothetical protein n=1 Tax=Nonomuraea dietziae TaxID=65515 RepID=UPI0031E450B9